LKGCIAKKDGSFLKPVLSDPNNYLEIDVAPENNPASATDGIKSFLNKSVVQFNGSRGPQFIEVRERIVDASDVSTSDGETFILEGNGKDPIVFEFDTKKYESKDYQFNANENLYRAAEIIKNVGTRDNLKNADLYIDANGKGTLTIYPDNKGKYASQDLYFALIITFEPNHPDRIGNPAYWWYQIG
jgi:predicted heme/steroid binding protein